MDEFDENGYDESKLFACLHSSHSILDFCFDERAYSIDILLLLPNKMVSVTMATTRIVLIWMDLRRTATMKVHILFVGF